MRSKALLSQRPFGVYLKGIRSVLFRRAMQQAEFYRNNIFRAYEKRVQPSIFICEFIDPGNLVLRVTDKDKVDYPG
jgi:hypothetical protein